MDELNFFKIGSARLKAAGSPPSIKYNEPSRACVTLEAMQASSVFAPLFFARLSTRTCASGERVALLMNNFIETPCSVVHRRSALPITGVFDESVQGAEDYELYLRIARQSELILHEAVVAEYRLHDGSLSRDAEQMILVTHRVLQMELPYLRGNRKKLRQLDRGRLFVRRHFGRRLTRELMGSGRLTIPEAQRKLKLLRRYYPLGFVAVALSRLLPAWLLNQSSPSCP